MGQRSMLGKVGLGLAIAGWAGVVMFMLLPEGESKGRRMAAALMLYIAASTGLVISTMGLYMDERKRYAIVGAVLAGMIFLWFGWGVVQVWLD